MIGWTHRDSEVLSKFVSISMREGGCPLVLTDGHYVYWNGRLVAAGQVKVGDVLQGGYGRARVVKSMAGDVFWRGLFNP